MDKITTPKQLMCALFIHLLIPRIMRSGPEINKYRVGHFVHHSSIPDPYWEVKCPFGLKNTKIRHCGKNKNIRTIKVLKGELLYQILTFYFGTRDGVTSDRIFLYSYDTFRV